jgi:hypothetical protein
MDAARPQAPRTAYDKQALRTPPSARSEKGQMGKGPIRVSPPLPLIRLRMPTILSSTSPRRATPCLLGIIWLPRLYLPGCKRAQPRRATSCPRLLTGSWDATPNRILQFAWKFGWLVETTLTLPSGAPKLPSPLFRDFPPCYPPQERLRPATLFRPVPSPQRSSGLGRLRFRR